MYLDDIAEIRQDVATLKVDVAKIQQEVQDLNEKIARASINNFSFFLELFILFYYLYIIFETIYIESEVLTKTMVVDAPTEQEKPAVTEIVKDKERVVEVSDAAKLEQCLEAVKKVETTHSKIMNDITQRVIALEKEIEHLSEIMNVMQATDKTDDIDIDINELVTKIQGIEADMERIGETIDKLFDDKEKKETRINVRASSKNQLIKILFIFTLYTNQL